MSEPLSCEHKSELSLDHGISAIEVHAWATSTMQSWTKEVKSQWRRQQRSKNMVRLRAAKKIAYDQMLDERERLESEVKRSLANLSRAVAVDSEDRRVSEEILRLALESDSLRSENFLFYERLQQFVHFTSLAQETAHYVTLSPEYALKSQSVHEASKTSQWVSCRRQSSIGWLVYFPNGSPSFYFDPITLVELDAMIKNCLDINSRNPPYVEPAGTLFGWKVNYAPLVRRAQDNVLIARAKFTTRAQIPLKDADAMLNHANINSWPFIVTPLNWSPDQRDGVSRQVLQEFDKQTHVMVCDIPDAFHTRYMHTARRLTYVDESGRQTVVFATIILDSEANRRNRAAEQYLNDVHWVVEGGTIVKFTEVDDTSIEVTYDHWASCQSKLHAYQLFTQWGEFSSRWSQQVMSMDLLEPESICDV